MSPLRFVTALFALGTLIAGAGAADLRISIPAQPAKAEQRNYWVNVLAQAIARDWKEGKVSIIGAASFEQSVANVVAGKADLHFPLMASPAQDDDELPYRYSRFTLHETPFNLYVRKDRERNFAGTLTIAALEKLRIETEQAHAGLFFFAPEGVADVATGLRRVSAGQSDGFLFAAAPSEAALKQLKLDNLVRIPYRRFQSKMVFAKGAAGDEFEEKVGLLIDRLKDSGEYQKIVSGAAGSPPRR